MIKPHLYWLDVKPKEDCRLLLRLSFTVECVQRWLGYGVPEAGWFTSSYAVTTKSLPWLFLRPKRLFPTGHISSRALVTRYIDRR